MTTKKFVYFLIFGFWSITNASAFDLPIAGGGKVDDSLGIPAHLQKSNACKKHYILGEPKFKNQEVNDKSIWRCYEGYAVQYHVEFKVPLWSAQVINMKDVSGDEFGRVEIFRPDPEVPERLQASLASYKGSGFDRGHMVPAHDMRFSRKSMDETFYLTNIVPQVGKNFNQGIWADLEKKVRLWSRYRGQLLIVTGPIFLNGNTRGSIGKNEKVQVPTHLFKVILDPAKNESIAFVMPNMEILTKKAKVKNEQNVYKCDGSYCSIENFATGVKEVERLTSIDFHSSLDKARENLAEKQDPVGKWLKLK